MMALGGGAVSYERGTPVLRRTLAGGEGRCFFLTAPPTGVFAEREFFIDNLLVRVHLIIAMIRWTGLAP